MNKEDLIIKNIELEEELKRVEKEIATQTSRYAKLLAETTLCGKERKSKREEIRKVAKKEARKIRRQWTKEFWKEFSAKEAEITSKVEKECVSELLKKINH